MNSTAWAGEGKLFNVQARWRFHPSIGELEVSRGVRLLIGRDAPGDRHKARELLTEAIAMYGRIGMPKHVEMAEALLGEL